MLYATVINLWTQWTHTHTQTFTTFHNSHRVTCNSCTCNHVHVFGFNCRI